MMRLSTTEALLIVFAQETPPFGKWSDDEADRFITAALIKH
jgi:hypothetical protein